MLKYKKITIKYPSDWKMGQAIFNLLEYMAVKNKVPQNQSGRLADTFQLQDEEFNKYLKEWEIKFM